MPAPVEARKSLGDALSKYLSAALDKDANTARSTVMAVLEENHSLNEVFEMISDAQSRIGELWEQNVIGIEDEHFATELALQLIRLASERTRPFRNEKTKNALLCCVEGEFHSVGLAMLAELLSNSGWNVQLLGPNQSFSAIYGAAKKWGARVDLICLSVTMPFNMPNLITTLKLLRSDPDLGGVPIMVGGKFPKSVDKKELLLDRDGAKLADAVTSDLVRAIATASSFIERRGAAVAG